MIPLLKKPRIATTWATFLLCGALVTACGPVPKPANAYASAPDLLSDMAALREKIKTMRLSGRVDHFGQEHRVQGKVFIFAQMPKRLRVDLLSPFGNSISVLTVNEERFAMSDLREGSYMEGPAQPCNIARLIQIPLPAQDVVRILVGHSPVIEGDTSVVWNRKGYYVVTVADDTRVQTLHVGPDREVLPLLRTRLVEDGTVVFDITFEKWWPVDSWQIPHEITVKIPREKTDLLIRYDQDGVETGVDLPEDAWKQEFPSGAEVQQVTCH